MIYGVISIVAEKWCSNRNILGQVIQTNDREIVEQRYAADYLCINANGESHHIHRMVALTFLPEPLEPVKILDVNHIDGDKLNNYIGNLEWATRSENCTHAYKTGLRPDNTPILVKDLRTGDFTEYYSLQECARQFKITGGAVHFYLKDISKVRKHFFVFIRKGQEWPNLTKNDIVGHRKGMPVLLIGKNMENGVITFYTNIAQAAMDLGIKAQTLYMHVKRHNDKPYHGHSFRFSDDPALINKADIRKVQKQSFRRHKRKPIPIRVISLETDEVTHWDSVEAFARSLNVKKDTIQSRIYRTGGFWGDYEIKYLNGPVSQ